MSPLSCQLFAEGRSFSIFVFSDGTVVDPWSSWLLSIFRGLGLRFESAEELSDIYPTPGGWWCSSLLLEEAMALVVP